MTSIVIEDPEGAYPEGDISILIPTFCYRDKVVRAVESALASGAGEIIVVDDHSRDGTIERLASYSDRRLGVYENERNLGLWENHLRAFKMATRPWIKFIQADDYLLPGGLARYAAAAMDGVSVVGAVPVIMDDETGETWRFHDLENPRRLTPNEIQTASLYAGLILGSPSQLMLRAEAIERDPEAWRTHISADMVVGLIAASRGDVVLLPPGAIASGAHRRQDSRSQGTLLSLERNVRSLAYLRARSEPGLRRFANLWAIINLKFLFKVAVHGLVYDYARLSVIITFARSLTDLRLCDWREVLGAQKMLRAAVRFRRNTPRPLNLDQLLDLLSATKRDAAETASAR